MKAAGVFVCARSTGRCLFLKHRATGVWESTGGKVEPGESALRAGLREFFEETGFSGDELRIKPRGRRIGDFTLFLGEVSSEFRPRLSFEHSAYTWASVCRPPTPLHPGLETFIRRI